MHNHLAIAVLMVLLGSIPSVQPALARGMGGETPAAAPGNDGVEFARRDRGSETDSNWERDRNSNRDSYRALNRDRYRDSEARRQPRRERAHHPRPRPNQRKIAENEGFKRVSDLVNFPKFF